MSRNHVLHRGLTGLFALSLFSLGSAVAGADPAADSTGADSQVVPVHVFTFNDFHGRINSQITLPFAQTLETAILSDPDNSMLVSAGDNIGASEFASGIADDQPTLDLLNTLAGTEGINFKASAVGNHEFDKGSDDLLNRVIGQDGSGAIDGWTYTASNVVNRASGAPVMDPYVIYTLGNGLTVGVVTAVTQATADLVSATGITDIEFTDPVTSVNQYAAQLKDGSAANGEADLVIAVYHEGALNDEAADGGGLDENLTDSSRFADIVNNTAAQVDALVNAHTHKLYSWTGQTAQDPEGLDHHPGRPVVQAASYGSNIGRIDLSFDLAKRQVVAASADTITVDKALAIDTSIGSMADIKADLDQALAQAAILGAPIVGRISSDITPATTGSQWVDSGNGVIMTATESTASGSSERNNESALANLVADAFLDEANQGEIEGVFADIGIVNAGGGLRDDLLAGADGLISYEEVNAVLPFANTLNTIDLTGLQVKQFLEQQWKTLADGSQLVDGRSFLVTGLSTNVTYTVDTDQPAAITCGGGSSVCAWDDPSSHISSVMVDGQLLEPDRLYRIVTLSFLTAGSDGYPVMLEGANNTDIGILDRDALTNYLLRQSQMSQPGDQPYASLSADFSHRSVVLSNLSAPMEPMGNITVTAGDTLEFTLSRLNMTSLGAPANDLLLVDLTLFDPDSGTDLPLPHQAIASPMDQADCNPGAVDGGANPESTGCVRVSLTIPVGVSAGLKRLQLIAEPSGTLIQLPLMVLAGDAPGQETIPEPDAAPSAPAASGSAGPQAHTGGMVVATFVPSMLLPWAVTLALVLAGAVMIGRRHRA
ncbi:MAG: 5'-nucleotidase C-terminal domain-containing protein [Propionibacteriaceae bacterium]|jgi:5'-nucleotidase|nr:5'-nucleotidase C-terminal domain-containing protein [Propionibacteriaceae bacterium]